jgi:Lipopolysaccharide-assembly
VIGAWVRSRDFPIRVLEFSAKISPALLVLFLGCATLGRGVGEIDSTPLTDEYKKFRAKKRALYIQNFDNRTYSPQLTGRLKEKLQFAFARSASLNVITEKDQADLVLYGKIELYAEEPGVYDRGSMPLTYNLTIIVSTRMRARELNPPVKSKKIEKESESMYEQHDIRYMTTYNIGEPLFETRYIAEERMLEGLADRIVSAMYEPESLEVKK